ncbi:GTP-binding protein Rhb1p [Diutina catenulata]
MKSRKLAIVGARSVGKSSMTVKYVEDHFVDQYYPTIHNEYSKAITFRGQQYSIEIVDTAGQDEFSMVEESQLIGLHGYLLVYSVTSRQSFELIELIRDKILNALGAEDDSIPMVVVGNKCDLQLQRQVESNEGAELARSLSCKFVETSVKDGVNVSAAFENLLAEIEGAKEEPAKCVIQ